MEKAFAREYEFAAEKTKMSEAGEIHGLKREYDELLAEYIALLEQTSFIARVGDRLQNKLDKSNEDLAEANMKLKETVNQLIKVKISRKARTIILISALFLFITLEGVAEPFIDVLASNFYLSLSIKGAIALSIKPLELALENFMLKKARANIDNKK